jgi:hypothetical protein
MIVRVKKPPREGLATIRASSMRVRYALRASTLSLASAASLASATECKIANIDHCVKSAPTTM